MMSNSNIMHVHIFNIFLILLNADILQNQNFKILQEENYLVFQKRELYKARFIVISWVVVDNWCCNDVPEVEKSCDDNFHYFLMASGDFTSLSILVLK